MHATQPPLRAHSPATTMILEAVCDTIFDASWPPKITLTVFVPPPASGAKRPWIVTKVPCWPFAGAPFATTMAASAACGVGKRQRGSGSSGEGEVSVEEE